MKLGVILVMAGGMIGAPAAPVANAWGLERLAQTDSGQSAGTATDNSQAEGASQGDQPPPPASPTTATIQVTVENVAAGRGTVWVALCDNGLSVGGCPYQMHTPATADSVTLTFGGIAPGTYAVAGYQDLNDNGVFDKFLGVPREPYALSGAAASELVPRFNDAALQMNAGDNAVTIRMKHLGG